MQSRSATSSERAKEHRRAWRRISEKHAAFQASRGEIPDPDFLLCLRPVCHAAQHPARTAGLAGEESLCGRRRISLSCLRPVCVAALMQKTRVVFDSVRVLSGLRFDILPLDQRAAHRCGDGLPGLTQRPAQPINWRIKSLTGHALVPSVCAKLIPAGVKGR
jgi:hypothetical protein